jgi:hypothetical protein
LEVKTLGIGEFREFQSAGQQFDHATLVANAPPQATYAQSALV